MTTSLTKTKNVDQAINQAIAEFDADQAFAVCEELLGIQRASGMALAKALGMIQAKWEVFGIADDFYDNASLRLSLHRHTIERYVKVYAMMANEVPSDVKPLLEQRNIGDLFPVANAIAQGYEIDPDKWNEIANAEDHNEIARIIREDVKDAEPRSGGLSLSMDRDGSLWASTKIDGNSHSYFIGSLEVTSDEEAIQKAINRIINNTGIMKR